MEKAYCLYIVQNNKKMNSIYIGISKAYKIRWVRHKCDYQNKNNKNYDLPIYRAFRKYGLTSFTFKIIGFCETLEELKRAEIKLISFYKKIKFTLYNVSLGGEGNFGLKHSDEAKIKIGNASRGRIPNAETRIKMSIHRKGKTFEDLGLVVTAETKAKMSKSQRGKKHTAEHNEKIGKAGLGKKHSDESIIKMQNAQLGEKHGGSKLSNAQREEIVCKYETGKYTYKSLGKEYGICAPQAHRINNDRRWRK